MHITIIGINKLIIAYFDLILLNYDLDNICSGDPRIPYVTIVNKERLQM